MLTTNEKKVLRFLATSIGKDYSINNVAKLCKLAPNGAYKILLKLEKEGILKVKTIANAKSYTLDFGQEKTERVLELAFFPVAIEGRIKIRAKDLASLKPFSQSCILFGSYISAKERPGDLDVLFILKQKNYEIYKENISKIQETMPIHIHDIIQTAEDLAQNLKKEDPVIIQALRTGIVLWGYEIIIQVIKSATR